MKAVTVALAVAYPVLMHVAVIYNWPLLRMLALCSLAAAIVVMPRLRSVNAWLLLLGIVTAIVALSKWDGARYAAYLPPIVMHALLLWVFARTLLPGREALITAIGRGARGGNMAPELAAYTRGVTILWSIFFATLLLLSVVLPFVSLYAWSLCTNLLNYAAIVAIVVCEFMLRRWRFPEHGHPNFIGYLRIVAKSNVRGF